MLDVVLRRTGRIRVAEEIFQDWVNLRDASRRFCWWVSPYVQLDSKNVADAGIVGAIDAFRAAATDGRHAQVREFLHGLMAVAPLLSNLRLSVKGTDGHWVIWQYDQPLCECMARSDRESIQIRMRESPLCQDALTIKLASYVCRFQDLELARFPVGGGQGRDT